ncbi:MAG TPA: pitrilysin family protein [Bryobacteraceae bacterium]|nr:pitrilysin family protein [Bryobacteraceae bacterium]
MRRYVRLSLISAALAFAFVAYSQVLPAGVQQVTSVEGINEYAFPNGLHLLLFPDLSKPKVTVNITYLVGSRHEGYGETGMAHLMEHMLFLRTKSGKDVKKELTDHGADWNGTTWYDRTNYFETVTASDENLRWAIGLEAERMTNMRIEKELLDTEMTVVRNEFEMGENSPFRMLYQRTLETAYSFHNYGKSTIGSRSDIENVPIERLAAFYRKYYQPDNALLTIAGHFDSAKALALVAESLGAIPRPQRTLDKTYTVEPTQDGERTVTLRRVGDNQVIMVVYHTAAATHTDSAVLEVLATVLGDTPSGRLHKALVESHKAVSTSADQNELHDPGFLMAIVRLREDQSLDEAREITLKTIAGLVSEPPSREEVERAKNRILKQIELDLNDSEGIGLTISEYAASGDWRLLFLDRDRIKSVTEQDVARAAKAYLKDSNRTVGVFIPTKSPDRTEVPATPEASAVLKDYKGGAAVAPGEDFSPAPANVEGRMVRQQLPGGVRVALLPRKTRGATVMAQVRLDFGDEHAVFGKATVGQLTVGMLMRGTQHKTRQQIQDESDRLKARIYVSGGATSATAYIETVEANLAGALRLAAEVLREPSFPESEFEQLRQQQVANVEANRSEPQYLGYIEMQRLLRPYPRGDVRYVGTPAEQIDDLKKVTLEDVRKFYAQFYGASAAEFVINGQQAAPEMQKLAADLFGAWKSPAPFTRVPTVYQKVEAASRKIETPDKQNALFAAGMNIRMKDDDPDYPAMVIANYIFGGSGGSRLFKRIRDKEGLSYGIYSNYAVPPKDEGTTFSVTAISAPQNTPKVEASFRDELARTVKDGFTADEVAAAKKSWAEERMVERSDDYGLLYILTEAERYDRTLKWQQDLETKVAALTPEQVSTAFRRHVDPAMLTYVRAGDFKRVGVLQ